MPIQEAVRYLTKADAARWFRRSERSLSRDITNAVKAADRDVLEHVRLRLEDGTIRPGTEITIEEIIRLRDDERQNPTWELELAWLESRYGRRGDTPQEKDEGAGEAPPLSGVGPREENAAIQPRELPAEPALRLAVLEAINSELETRNKEKDNQIRRLEIELDRRAEERREENELQKQNNVLMQQIYNLLSKMQESTGEVGVLPPSRKARSLPASTAPDQEPSRPVDAAAAQSAEAATSHKEGTRATLGAAPKKRPAARRKATADKRPTSAKATESKIAKQPDRKLFPTLDRLARSLFRR